MGRWRPLLDLPEVLQQEREREACFSREVMKEEEEEVTAATF